MGSQDTSGTWGFTDIFAPAQRALALRCQPDDEDRAGAVIRYRDIPYLIHTNRELGLMLRGAKPLARFSGCHGHDPECLLRYIRMFDRHVALGRFVRAELSEPVPQRPQLTGWTVFYALPGEEWRIGAMIELFERPGPWSDEREREEGALLGYQDWQNDWWITYLQRQGGQGYASQPKPAEDLA